MLQSSCSLSWYLKATTIVGFKLFDVDSDKNQMRFVGIFFWFCFFLKWAAEKYWILNRVEITAFPRITAFPLYCIYGMVTVRQRWHFPRVRAGFQQRIVKIPDGGLCVLHQHTSQSVPDLPFCDSYRFCCE